MTNLEKLTARIHKLLPEILDLKFGTAVLGLHNKNWTLIYENKGNGMGQRFHFVKKGHITFWSTSDKEKFEILGRTITLADVLRAIREAQNFDYKFIVRADGLMFDEQNNSAEWNLAEDDLSKQGDETVQFLLELIK